MKQFVVLGIFLFTASEALTSVKGIKAEIIAGCYKVFRDTSMAEGSRSAYMFQFLNRAFPMKP
jgi:hypothetical protein